MNDRHKNRGGHNKIELTGKRFGKLIVLSDTGRRKSKRPIWKCKCDCGKEVEVLGKYLLVGDTKSCGCYNKGNAHNRTGFKQLGGSYFSHVKINAKRRGIPFEITAKEAYNLLENQGFKCVLTDEPINLVWNYHDDGKKQTASLDRIDNTKGYSKNNIQWVHKKINIMRNALDLSEFKVWCSKVVNHL